MNDLLNTIFNLRGMGFGDPGVELSLARPLPAWGWFIALLVAAAIAAWGYARIDGPRSTRLALAALRALILLALLVLFTGPQLVRPNERTEPDWAIVLVDRSASMTVPDGQLPGSARATREEQLRDALNEAAPAWVRLAATRRTLWMGFDAAAFDLKTDTTAQPTLDAPAGRRTSLATALDQALARVAARPVSGVIVLTDGRSIDEPSKAAIKRLQTEQIPVLVLPLGSPEPIADLAIAQTTAPQLAFRGDTIPIQVDLERSGPATASGTLELIDKQTGLVLDRKPLPPPDQWAEGKSQLTLTHKAPPSPDSAQEPPSVTAQSFVVRLVPGQADLLDANNQSELAIELVSRPLRVAYFDGYPRWEQRYVKNLLLRERSIRSANLLLAANRQYLQEGDVLVEALPRTTEDWAQFDVIILGDLPGTLFSKDQLDALREHVSTRGAGLLWIAGPAATPAAWRDTPLADLLPFTLTPSETDATPPVAPWPEPVLLAPTPAAERFNLFQLADPILDSDQPSPSLSTWPPALADPASGWSLLRYAQRIDPAAVKPTAEVLARFIPATAVPSTTSEPATTSAAVLTMRYGAGRVMYVATDEIWRWRYARGETLPERFWLPLIRLQGRDALARTAKGATLDVSPRRPQIDQPVTITVRLHDQALVDNAPARLNARVRPLDPADPRAAAPVDLTLQPDSSTSRAARSYTTTWTPTEPGKVRLDITDALLAAQNLAADIDITVADDELRAPETDHPLLQRFVAAAGTGSATLTTADLATLDTRLPRRQVTIAATPDIRTLWDTAPALTLLLLLLALEWIGRRLIKLA